MRISNFTPDPYWIDDKIDVKIAEAGGVGGGGAAVWGGITGTLSAQTDLSGALAGKQPLATVLTNTTAAFTAAQETKLSGIAAGATVNATDANLRDRATHTGAQAISTVTGLQTALDGKQVAGSYQPLATALTNTTASFTTAKDTLLGNQSGINTGDQTSVSGNAGTATALATGRTISMTGDVAWTSPAFDGTGSVTAAGTLATVNANVGTFGSASLVPVVTVNAKGLVTAVTTVAVSGGGGGGSLSGLATITVPNGKLEHSEQVAAVGVTGASRIFLALAPGADADENVPEMLDIVSFSGLPGTDILTISATFSQATSGPIKFNWSAA